VTNELESLITNLHDVFDRIIMNLPQMLRYIDPETLNLVLFVDVLRETLVDLQGDHYLLPEIVVVGDQSGGKSTLLERFLRRAFFATGADMVTRAPVKYRMRWVPPKVLMEMLKSLKPGVQQPYGEFVAVFETKKGSVSLADAKKVREMIDVTIKADLQATLTPEQKRDNVCTDKWVSDKAVEVTVYCCDMPSLTLVDLPGLFAVRKTEKFHLRLRKF
jgi:hypothetical protein